MFNSPQNRKPGFKLALISTCFALSVIILGAFTRLVDAGLGCPDWPGCYGHILWPNDAEEIAAANQAFPDAPVELDKTWPEMVHRYLATGLGVFCIALVALAFRYRKEGQPFKLPLFLLAFVILQGMFGMWTVTLKLWPQVVTAHLLGGFTTFSLLWLLTLRLNNQHLSLPGEALEGVQKLRPLALIGLLVLVGQITLGGWTTSNYAAVACPDLPTCQAQWWPQMDFSSGFNVLQGIGPNYLGGVMDNDARVAIHMSHRIGAIITLLYLGWLSLSLVRLQQKPLQVMGTVLGSVLVVQFLLGLGNIFFNFPLFVTTSHNAVGALLLLCMVTLNYQLITARVGR